MKNEKNIKWFLIALSLALLAAWSPLAADAAAGRRDSNSGGPATTFSCHAFPLERPDLIQYGFVGSARPQGVLRLANGMSIELERTQPGRMVYKYMRDGKQITRGVIEASTSQFAMSAGGPWGAELHCVTAREIAR